MPYYYRTMKKLDIPLLWITPLIAITVIVNQFYRVHTFDLSTWQGGGFGMFSSVDTIYSRFIKIYLKIDGKIVPVELKGDTDDLGKLATIVRAEPTQENLHKLTQLIYAANWIQSGSYTKNPNVQNTYRPVLKISNNREPESRQQIKIDSAHLELWKTQFNSDTNSITTYKHTEYVYPPDSQ